MTDNVKYVLKGFLKLTEEEQKELIEEVRKALNQNNWERKQLNEQLEKYFSRVVGPIDQGKCPCCNR